ncbi:MULTISPECIES: hypothetical protein [unclassified Curtobacterium]|uniref:hypothetical protein n=1 Tax=unclassified Curtobacterium TaxID=257496 RepID=UPI0038011C9F
MSNDELAFRGIRSRTDDAVQDLRDVVVTGRDPEWDGGLTPTAWLRALRVHIEQELATPRRRSM